MLVAGSDVSGNTIGGGQHRHIAFIIGEESSINSLYNKIGLDEIHMVRLDESRRTEVIQKLDFTRYDIRAWCFYVEKQNVIDYIYNHNKLARKTRSKEKIFKHFDYLLLKKFKVPLEEYTYKKRTSISDIVVQCDSDMTYTVDNWRMKKESKGRAFELADAVAWCNEKDRSIKGCVDLDLKEIKLEMESDLLK